MYYFLGVIHLKPITIFVVLLALLAVSIVGCGSPTSTAATPTSMAVTCASTTLNGPGLSTQCKAVLTLSDGTTQDQTTAAQWTSSDQTILTVTSGGLVTSQAGGSAVITAAFSGVSGTKTITVSFLAPLGKLRR